MAKEREGTLIEERRKNQIQNLITKQLFLNLLHHT